MFRYKLTVYVLISVFIICMYSYIYLSIYSCMYSSIYSRIDLFIPTSTSVLHIFRPPQTVAVTPRGLTRFGDSSLPHRSRAFSREQASPLCLLAVLISSGLFPPSLPSGPHRASVQETLCCCEEALPTLRLRPPVVDSSS